MGSFANGQDDAVELKFYVKNTFFYAVEENDTDLCMPRRRSAPALGQNHADLDSARLLQSLIAVTEDVAQGARRPSVDESAQPMDFADSDCDDSDGDEDDVEDIHSVVVKGIPRSYYGEDILNIFAELGFKSQPDFFHVPMAQGKNFGYAMIGFTDLQTTKDFAKALTGYRFPQQAMSEIVTVTATSFDALLNTR